MMKPPPVHRGEDHHNAKLTVADVLAIRARYAKRRETQEAIALDYEVTQGTISAVVRKEFWRLVP